MRILQSWLCLLFVVFCLSTADAQLSKVLLENGKKATVLVRANNSTGTAFCIDPRGVFVTSHHVVEGGLKKGIRLVVFPGEENEREIIASVLRTDPNADLTLLQVGEKEGPFPFIALGESRNLIETSQVVAFGYPFGQDLAMLGQKNPNISVNGGRVTSLRKLNGQLEQIQLDTVLNPGNSGGPVVDESGKVVGIVESGIQGAGINFAIPVTKLRWMMNRAVATLDSYRVPFDKRFEQQDFKIKVHFLSVTTIPTDKISVEISFLTGKTKSATYKASPSRGEYWEVRAVQLPRSYSTDPVQITVAGENGNVSTEVPNQIIKISGQNVALSTLKSMKRDIQSGAITAELSDGTTISGRVEGWEGFQVRIGGNPVRLNSGNLDTIQLKGSQNQASMTPIFYHILVKYLGTTVAESSGSVNLTDAPKKSTRTVGNTTSPEPVKAQIAGDFDDVGTVTLPAPMSDLTVGAGGRYLFLNLKSIRKLAVFDVSTAKIVRYLPLVSDDVWVAASAEKLVMVSEFTNTIERYDLRTFERELTVPRPETGPIRGVAMGYASNGPLMILTPKSSGPGLYDLNTLRKLDLNGKDIGNGWNDASYRFYFFHLRVSPDGKVFSQWHSPLSYYGPDVIRVKESGLEQAKIGERSGPLIPSVNGQYFFSSKGLLNYDLNDTGASKEENLLPTYSEAYYLSAQTTRDASQRDLPAFQASVYSLPEKRLLMTLPKIPELALPNRRGFGINPNDELPLTLDKRLHFYPMANLLVTIPYTNDQLVIRRFDLIKEMEKAGIDYLFVASAPPPMVRKGQTYNYQVDGKSRRGGLKITLESGPVGMLLSATGKLTWKVPTAYNSTEENVILRLKDNSGQEIFHTFKINILP